MGYQNFMNRFQFYVAKPALEEQMKVKEDILFTVFSMILPGDRDKEEIERICRERKGIKDYALILHNRDQYSREDEEIYDVREGERKPAHYHLIVRGKSKLSMRSLSRWFGIETEKIEKSEKGGVGGFNGHLLYLLHLNEESIVRKKEVYESNEIISNIRNIEERISKINEMKKRKEYLDSIRNEAFNGERNPEEIRRKYHLGMEKMPEIIRYYRLGRENRKIKEEKEIPEISKSRVNIYIYGSGGVGKTTLCDSIAWCLYPFRKPEEIIFNTSSHGSTIRNYKNQPVLIWDDIRPENILADLGGRCNFLRIFRPNPRLETVNVKYGSITLVNKYNLINSYQSFGQFIGYIIGNEDKNQYLRRFPIVIHVMEDNFTIFRLKSSILPKFSLEFKEYDKVHGNISDLVSSLPKDEFNYAMNRMLRSLISLIKEVEDNICNNSSLTVEEREAVFRRNGLDYSDYLKTRSVI